MIYIVLICSKKIVSQRITKGTQRDAKGLATRILLNSSLRNSAIVLLRRIHEFNDADCSHDFQSCSRGMIGNHGYKAPELFFRNSLSPIIERGNAWKHLPFEQFQTCAATRADVCHFVGEARLTNRGGRVAAANHDLHPVVNRFG